MDDDVIRDPQYALTAVFGLDVDGQEVITWQWTAFDGGRVPRPMRHYMTGVLDEVAVEELTGGLEVETGELLPGC